MTLEEFKKRADKECTPLTLELIAGICLKMIAIEDKLYKVQFELENLQVLVEDIRTKGEK